MVVNTLSDRDIVNILKNEFNIRIHGVFQKDRLPTPLRKGFLYNQSSIQFRWEWNTLDRILSQQEQNHLL